MKKINSLCIILICIMLLTSCNSTQNTSDASDPVPEKLSEYVSNAPGVTAEMNTADYWISQYDDSDEMIMDLDEINKINRKNEPTLSIGKNKEIALSEIKENISGNYVKFMLDAYAVPEKPSAYFADGKSTSPDYWNGLIANMDTESVPENVSVKFGFTTERTDIKAAPTSAFISDSSQDHFHYCRYNHLLKNCGIYFCNRSSHCIVYPSAALAAEQIPTTCHYCSKHNYRHNNCFYRIEFHI